MKFTVRQIAQLIGGEVEGDDSLEIDQFYKIEEGQKGGISFLANPKYEAFIYKTGSSAVIVADSFIAKDSINSSLIKVKDPYSSFSVLLSEYEKLNKKKKVGISALAFIDPTAELSENVYIGNFSQISENSKIGEGSVIYPQVFIDENVTIGKNCILYAGVKLFADTVIGDNCTIHGGAVIGCDGFGFAPQKDGTYKNVPQTGNVILGDNISIGSNSSIDRATIGSTIIKNGAKIDNLVQVGHNVTIGKNTVIASQTGIAGSTKIGDNCSVGGQVGFAGHLEVANGTKIGAQSGINTDVVKENLTLNGTPHMEMRKHQRSLVFFRKLPELDKRISDLEKKKDN
ncbi:UDP-3-O-(3-hydroxymyristoyl)glucosamine N-acyltransferase [Arcticibacterium luteifluviistationis]|uniref:UDP-3-O-acylglucosamine N-acyltransferase n=1 Tax=Arcticibacterium luteifluviistationis TaxID=1784714 RepID=A0A2Z4GBE0_9BACT|nr:UDP-3-O-(3-hydroxymyristoyl)glucosamine N-acyltransferase [Arcticibacterium luteifluviistationis]AWV98454.1 UDP-3-O-(3-hydroxymyristoyl)glucosamine N-acyltransferase [Arcticibacterium luteifluviistationis]